MEVVTGFSDWEFLKPDTIISVSSDEPKRHRNISLEDFDGELAVFQVCEIKCTCTCTCTIINIVIITNTTCTSFKLLKIRLECYCNHKPTSGVVAQ